MTNFGSSDPIELRIGQRCGFHAEITQKKCRSLAFIVKKLLPFYFPFEGVKVVEIMFWKFL